ncbi:MAG: glycosyltransferase family 4 protein [Candidatus Polarisedimenticolaceae bacterium]|nr:glycosyltransferase family 4 protein [Candidatus Polarisedimenticolaceae bacterium]
MILSILLIFLASLGLTGALRYYALKQGIIDNPNERSSHTTPTPRGGGLSFVITFLIALAGAYLFEITEFAPQTKPFLAIFCSGLLVAAIGFWDDHVHIPARWRFLTHSVAALIGLYLLGIPEIPLPGTTINLGFIGYPLGIIALVWLLNLFNFMDGIDGIAGSEALFVGISAIVIMQLTDAGDFSAPIFWLSILMAGVAGFLVWNWPPAKIFMGDAGSGFLGLMLGLFALWSANLGLSIWCWIILLALFITDATVTLLRRMLNGERWFEAHRSHLYQQLSRKWSNHHSVTLALISLNAFWLFPLAWLATSYPSFGLVTTLAAYLPLVLLAIIMGSGKREQYE